MRSAAANVLHGTTTSLYTL